MGRTKRNWTPHEDALLRAAVNDALANSRPLLWRDLAKAVPGRTNKDCRRRWWNALAEGIAKGPWSEKEDERLIEAVRKYGTQWSLVAQAVGSRNSEQCSSHWAQVLDPSINYCDWSREEDEALLHAVLTHGTNWTKIAATHVPRRTTLALKNRYSSLRLRHRNQTEQRNSTAGASYLVQHGQDTSSNGDSPEQQTTSKRRKRAHSTEDSSGYERNDHDRDEDNDDDDDDDDEEDENKENNGGENEIGTGDTMSLDLSPRDHQQHRDQAMSHSTSRGMHGTETEASADGTAISAPPPTGVSDSHDAWVAFQGAHDEHMSEPMSHAGESNGSYRPSSAAPLMGSRMSDLSDFSTYPPLPGTQHYGGSDFRPDGRPEELKVSPQFADTAQLSGFLFPPLPADAVSLTEFDHSVKRTAGTESFRWSPIGTNPGGLSPPQIGEVGQHNNNNNALSPRKSVTSESATGATPRQLQPLPQQQQQQQQQQQRHHQQQLNQDDCFSSYGTIPVSPASTGGTGGSGTGTDIAPSPSRPALYRVSVQVTCDQEQLVCLMSRITNVGTQLSVQVDPQQV
ncbi:hypothetical protein VTH82DRAFT_6779 [Thermothelomyces myriococcoides]